MATERTRDQLMKERAKLLPKGFIEVTIGTIEPTDLFYYELKKKWVRVPEGGIGLEIQNHFQPIAKKV